MGKADPITATTVPDAGHPYKAVQRVPRGPHPRPDSIMAALPASTPPAVPDEMQEDEDTGGESAGAIPDAATPAAARATAAPSDGSGARQFEDTPPAEPPGPGTTGPVPSGDWAAQELSRLEALGNEERQQMRRDLFTYRGLPPATYCSPE